MDGQWQVVNNLPYADDIDLIADTVVNLQKITEYIKQQKIWSLEIKKNKIHGS